jgi:D-methionine transport system substrate-binding protein
MKKTVVLTLIAALLVSGCGSSATSTTTETAETQEETSEVTEAEETADEVTEEASENQISPYARELKYRRLPTATSDLFEEGILPILEREGYTLTPVEITDSVQRELALSEGEIDFHVDAHSAYLKKTNEAQGTDLMGALAIPTVPTGIYPGAKDDLADIADGDTIAFPDDASNEARALLLLQNTGLIKMDENVSPSEYTLLDIAENPYNLEFTEMSGGTIAAVREDFAYIILRGSDAYNSGIDFNTALAGESQDAITDDNRMQLCINAANADEGWVQDIIAAYKSDEFKEFMSTQSDIWILPDYLQ